MPASETLDIIIRGRDEFGKVVGGINQQLTRTQQVAQRTGRAINRLRSGMGRMRRSVLGLRGAIAGLGLGLLARQFIQASNEQQKAIEGLNASLRAMGRFTPELSSNLQQVASSLQGVTNFGDEATIQGQKFLATYRNITDDLLPRASKAMLDYAALLGGDTVQAANALGKASLGMTGELRRSGIVVEANTFKQEGFLGVLREIEAQVGGQAEAQRRATGSLVAFGNVVGDTQEFLGDLLKLALEPLLGVLVEEFGNLNTKIQQLKEEGQLHIWAEQWATVILDFLELIAKGIGLVADAFWGWRLIWESLKIAFSFFAQALNTGIQVLTRVYSEFFKLWQNAFLKLADTIDRFDITGKFRGVSQAARAVADTFGSIGDGIRTVSDGAKENAEFWKETRREAGETLDALIRAESPSKRIGDFFEGIATKVRAASRRIREMEQAQIDAGKTPPIAQASFEQQSKSLILRAREVNATIVAEYQDAFAKGEKSAEEFFAKRKELLEDDFRVTKQSLEAQAEIAKLSDPTKELKIRDQIFKAEQKFRRDSIKLAQEQEQAEEKINDERLSAQDLLNQIRERAFDSSNLEEVFENERRQLELRQQEEMTQLQDHLNRKLITEEQFQQAKNNMILESENQLADQQSRLRQAQLDAAKATFGELEQAFGDLYEGTGRKIKAFFVLQKAAAVANTLIATYESAQQVYKSAAQIPIIGQFLAPAAAAIAIAAGLARVAMIRSQSLAKGGEVEGRSPHKRADNIPAMLTAGEFVQPVDTVRHYGAQAMEAIRKRLVPKSLLSGYGISMPRPNHGYAFQAGGRVPPGATPPDQLGGDQRGVVIANFYDPEELTRFLATSRGQDAVVNAIAGRRETVRKVIQ